MAETLKTANEIEDIFRLVVLKILSLDPDAAENRSRVRFPWGSDLAGGTSSAPGWPKDRDVCMVYALPQDNFYNRQRDVHCEDHGGRDLVSVDEHTDVHFINFANYGPAAYECARDIRDGLFSDEIRDFLAQNNFALAADVPAIRRVPELFNGEWRNRVDISAVFNEYVRRERVVKTIEKVHLNLKAVDSAGLALDKTSVIEK